MRKRMKFWLISATALVLVGLIGFGGFMAMLKWDFTRLGGAYETVEHAVTERFESISLQAGTACIEILPTEGDARVVCYEKEGASHAVAVNEGVLSVKLNDQRRWYERLVDFGKPKITVYLPEGKYEELLIRSSTGDVTVSKDFGFLAVDIALSTGNVFCYASASEEMSIQTDTGNITLENAKIGALTLCASTGDITAKNVTALDVSLTVSTGRTALEDLTCKSLSSLGDTGDILLKSVIAKEEISVERSTGDVTFDGCDAAQIDVETSTGDVKGSLLSEKVFFAETDTGRKSVPKTQSGGRCEIETSTGDIIITLKG